MKLDYHQGTSGTYAGFDRFGRVKDQRWYDYGASADAVRIKHGYDLAGNRLWREDVAAAAESQNLDEFYTYDQLNRLFWWRRGDLNAGKTGIEEVDTNHFEVTTLDAPGNWNFYGHGANHSSIALAQTRTHDATGCPPRRRGFQPRSNPPELNIRQPHRRAVAEVLTRQDAASTDRRDHHRYYHTGLGTFVTRDPIEYNASAELRSRQLALVIRKDTTVPAAEPEGPPIR